MKSRFAIQSFVFISLLGIFCTQLPTEISSQDIYVKGQSLSLQICIPDDPQIAYTDYNAIVCISASDMDTIAQDLRISNEGIMSGTVNNIPAGNDRLIEIIVCSSEGKICYYGSALTSIAPNQTAYVDIILTRSTGTVVVAGHFDTRGADSATSDENENECNDTLYMALADIREIPIAPIHACVVNLNLIGSTVRDIGNVETYTNLQYLSLAFCDSIEDHSPLGNLINLKELDLSYSDVDDISSLANMKSLVRLHLCGCENITDISSLQNLTSIRFIEMEVSAAADHSPLLEIMHAGDTLLCGSAPDSIIRSLKAAGVIMHSGDPDTLTFYDIR